MQMKIFKNWMVQLQSDPGLQNLQVSANRIELIELLGDNKYRVL